MEENDVSVDLVLEKIFSIKQIFSLNHEDVSDYLGKSFVWRLSWI
jgi:hypothetical protein